MDGKVVLVVEDNSDELMIYQALLTHRGYTVLAADGFNTALDTARRLRPDVAVVDVNLGEARRDGCDLVHALRADPATARMPVIAHTAYGDVYRQALQHAGCDEILHKPTRPAALLRAVEQLIGPPEAPAPQRTPPATAEGTPPVGAEDTPGRT
jgi:CheY-like chemotaxis protein